MRFYIFDNVFLQQLPAESSIGLMPVKEYGEGLAQ